MSESNETPLDGLQILQDSVEGAVEGTTLTIDYKDEELESKTILLQDLMDVSSAGISYMQAGDEVVDTWKVVASVKLTEPTDVVETDV
jgi:hypothetical protein